MDEQEIAMELELRRREKEREKARRKEKKRKKREKEKRKMQKMQQVRETPHARNPSEECAGGSHTCMVIFSGVTSHDGGK